MSTGTQPPASPDRPSGYAYRLADNSDADPCPVGSTSPSTFSNIRFSSRSDPAVVADSALRAGFGTPHGFSGSIAESIAPGSASLGRCSICSTTTCRTKNARSAGLVGVMRPRWQARSTPITFLMTRRVIVLKLSYTSVLRLMASRRRSKSSGGTPFAQLSQSPRSRGRFVNLPSSMRET
jgi:hypothetical protein